MILRSTRAALVLAAIAGLLLAAASRAQGPATAAASTVAPRGASSAAAGQGDRDEAALLARIRGEIGPARCRRDAQCHTLAVGEKACGGPAQYLAWSGPAARGEKLKAWSVELAALQRQRYAASGLMSNCQFMPDPGAACVQQRCVLRADGAGGLPVR